MPLTPKALPAVARALGIFFLFILVADTARAQSAGCDYWDKFQTSQIASRLEQVRARWLSIEPSEAEIDAEFRREVESLKALGYNRAAEMARDMGVEFYVRRVRMREYEERFGEPETDEELWTYCLSGRSTDCADFFSRNGRPAKFDAAGALAEDDPLLRETLDELRDTVSEFNMYAQIVALTYCSCDGSGEAVAVCDAARSALFRDF